MPLFTVSSLTTNFGMFVFTDFCCKLIDWDLANNHQVSSLPIITPTQAR